LSNAMDVGNPSNFARMQYLLGETPDRFTERITGYSVSDEETLATITQTLTDFNYLLDPHGAVGFRSLLNHFRIESGRVARLPVRVEFETDDPAKFLDTVEPLAGERLVIPEALRWYLNREKQAVPISSKHADLQAFLLAL